MSATVSRTTRSDSLLEHAARDLARRDRRREPTADRQRATPAPRGGRRRRLLGRRAAPRTRRPARGNCADGRRSARPADRRRGAVGRRCGARAEPAAAAPAARTQSIWRSLRRQLVGRDVAAPGLSATAVSVANAWSSSLEVPRRSTRRRRDIGSAPAGSSAGSARAARRAADVAPPRRAEQLLDPADDELRLERLGQHAVAADGGRPRLVDGSNAPVSSTTGICARRGVSLMCWATS